MYHFPKSFRILWSATVVALLLSLLPGASSLYPNAALAAVTLDSGDEIVFIGDDGCIRVLDPYQTDGNREVKWESTSIECGWTSAALGDFNNDGDREIVAIGGGSSTGKLAVYDPVVASGATTPGQEINGIPWETLYHTSVSEGEPVLVAADDYDTGVPGDEIFYTVDRNDSDDTRAVILKGTSGNPDGRSWTPHIEGNFGNVWDHVATGNIDNTGVAELILIDEDGEMGAYRPAGGLSRFYRFPDSSPWQAAAIGQVYAGGPQEVVAGRNADNLASLFIFQYDNDSFNEASGDALSFSPYPRNIFLPDLNNSGDDEVIFLRRDAPSRMVMRNRGSDGTITIELPLDDDNGYKVGAGGDVDGDGNDEIIIMRDNNIRIYTEANTTVDDSSIRNFGLDTDEDTLVAGDLDKNGFITGPEFQATPSSLTVSLPQATYVSGNFTVKIENVGTSNSVPFTIDAGITSWITVTPTSGSTPTDLTIQFDATGRGTGSYSTDLVLNTTASDAVNTPYKIPLTMNVTDARVDLSPDVAEFVYQPCSQYDVGADGERSQAIDVGGTNGIKFTATLLPVLAMSAASGSPAGDLVGGYADAENVVLYDDRGNVTTLSRDELQPLSASATNAISWTTGVTWTTSITSEVDTIPTKLHITVDARKAPQPLETTEALLIIVADSRAGETPSNVRILPVRLSCIEGRIFAPLLAR